MENDKVTCHTERQRSIHFPQFAEQAEFKFSLKFKAWIFRFVLTHSAQNDKFRAFVILSVSEVSTNLKCGLHLKVWIFRYAQNDSEPSEQGKVCSKSEPSQPSQKPSKPKKPAQKCAHKSHKGKAKRASNQKSVRHQRHGFCHTERSEVSIFQDTLLRSNDNQTRCEPYQNHGETNSPILRKDIR